MGLGNLPGAMDYGMTGFDMGIQDGNRPPTPKYSPPPEPEKGFTRSPDEDEVVVCPNCGDELAVGVEEAKQEVWVVKGCGHVSLIRLQGTDETAKMLTLMTGLLWRLRAQSRKWYQGQEGQG